MKNALNINAKIEGKKVCEIMRKCFQNDTKTRSKIYDKSMNFQNLRFLDFCCEEYNVKIVFSHDQGYQKSIKNQSKIYANTMLEKGLQKSWKMLQNGPKMGAEIDTNPSKNEVQKCVDFLDQSSETPSADFAG